MSTGNPPVVLPNDELSHHRAEYPEWWYFHGHLYEKESGYLLASFEYTAIEIVGLYYAYASLTHTASNSYLGDDRLFGDYQADTSDHSFALELERSGTEPANRWKISSKNLGSGQFRYTLSVISAREDMTSWAAKLRLTENRKPLLVGDQGRIPDGDDPSWLYSRTRLDIEGTVRIGNNASVAVSGRGWMDHQWGKPKPANRTWRWFGISMDETGGKTEGYLFMLVTNRNDPAEERIRLGYLIDDAGAATPLSFNITPTRFWKDWPVDNEISFDHPVKGAMTLNIEADIDKQERVPKPRLAPEFQAALEATGIIDMLTFWEGSGAVHDSKGVTGRAYTELGGF